MSRRARTGLVATVMYALVVSFFTPHTPVQAQTSLRFKLFVPGIVAQPQQAQSVWSTPEMTAFSLINQQRRANGCSDVQLNTQLGTAARKHSQDMADKGFVSHTGSDGSNFTQRAKAAGYTNFASGEIIAAGQSTPADAVTSWMNSPGHRAILLTCANDHVGVGYVEKAGSPYRFYWTAVFGQQ